MKSSFATTCVTLAALAAAGDAALSVANQHAPGRTVLDTRALPANAPHGYAPQVNTCPSNKPTIRDGGSLSSEETSWLQVRRKAIITPMRDLLGRLDIKGLDTDKYIDSLKSNLSSLPNIGIAVSGGGYRAMTNGAGVLEAFDDRTPDSTSKGQLGGLLQSATYLSALSGGNWLVGSLYTNNFTSINTILAQDSADANSGDLWQLGNSIFEGPGTGGIQLLDSVGYYNTLYDDVTAKKNAGFNITITDYWGRALSFQLVNATNGGPDYTFSSIAKQDWFTSGSVPLPFIITDGRRPGETIVSSNGTVYNFNPWEFGTEDSTVYGFVPLQYIGTNFSGGSPKTDKCVTGFDNVGFVMGTSSTIFNAVIAGISPVVTQGWPKILQTAISGVLDAVGATNVDIADYPNPFYNYRSGSNRIAGDAELTLVDGGEDGQNIPFHPLIQTYRHVDVIFAVDSSSDTNSTYFTSSATNWPLGISMIATYERTKSAIGNGTAFPPVPDVNTFVNLGLNNKPTFFGCDASNLTGPAPLIVYLPNAPYVYYSNLSTFDTSFNDTKRNDVILNGYDLATQGNGSINSDWPACVGCAILSRSFDRTNTNVPSVCKQCFSRYCWNGTIDSSSPKPYKPTLMLKEVSQKGAAGRFTSSAMLAVAVAIVWTVSIL